MGKVIMSGIVPKLEKPNQGLPSGYTKLEYIESSGTQYIDTGFAPNQDTRVVMDVYPTSLTSTSDIKCLFGTRNASSPTASLAYNAWVSSITVGRSDYFGTNQSLSGTFNTRMIVDKNKNVCTMNDITVTNTATTAQATNNLFLLACNNSGSPNYYITAQLYSCQIYDNDILIRDFVPCVDNDGSVGMFDLINQIFYPNAGTGTFVGSEVA